MNQSASVIILTFYGLFLIICGIVSVAFIGRKAKTALLSGGMSGVFSLTLAQMISNGSKVAQFGSLFLALALLVVFSWRSTKTLFKIFEMISASADPEELRGKGIAFLIISLMAIVSIFVFAVQLTYL